MRRIAEIEKREKELDEMMFSIMIEQKKLAAEKAILQYEAKHNENETYAVQDIVTQLISEGVSVEDAIATIGKLVGKSTYAGRNGYDY